MRQTTPSTSTRQRLPGFQARDLGESEAYAWLVRQLGWEDRLMELHVRAGVQPSARRLESQRAVPHDSDVLDPPRCSAGVYA